MLHGNERRNIIDARMQVNNRDSTGTFESMGQFGAVGGKRVRAWGHRHANRIYIFRSQLGTTARAPFDAASGDRHPGDGSLETFNPLFPNGYYFTVAGYTGYVEPLSSETVSHCEAD